MDSLKNILIPAAIVLGAMLIAAAVFFKDYGGGSVRPMQALREAQPAPTQPANAPIKNADAVRTETRHLYGAADAPVTIVEFSDLECPFCARLHTTLKRVVDESNGAVNWEYRHMPLPNHPNAAPAALASECVAKAKGTDAFFSYVETIFENLGKANAAFLKSEAAKLGVSGAPYDTCITDPSIKKLVDADRDTGTRLGGSGTPYSVIVNNQTGTGYPLQGALPYEQWKVAITRAQSGE